MTAAPQHLYIVTGTSRGLGAALALELLRPGQRLLCLARGHNEALDRAPAGAQCEQWSVDLADPTPVAGRLEAWLRDGPVPSAGATLINNAALLVAPGPVDGVDAATLSAALRVGLEAPLLLSAAFLHATRGWPGPRRVLNISSGLGRRAMAGQGSYCAVKAGLDHLSRAMALDEAQRPDGARIVSLAPGVIETSMQQQLRAAGPEGLPDHDVFVEMQRSGQLNTPEATAARIVAWLNGPSFGDDPIADIRNA